MAQTETPTIAASLDSRPYTRSEIVADAVVHVVGMGLSIAGSAILLAAVAGVGDTARMLAACLYSISLVIVLWLSAAYNLLRHPRWKEKTRPYDHAAIFLLIAGTYTPFLLVGVARMTGYILLVTVWLLAITGVALKLLHPRRYDRLFVAFYLALGWIGLPIAGLLVATLPPESMALIAIGGVLYTAGVAFHLWERLPYQNAIWHGFVLLAAVCHFFAVLKTLGNMG